MCNIAGYVGTKPAAPILIDMIRREEGFNGGYYTGIATIHEGRIYYAKLTGDIDRLLAETDAASLPGTIGILHSRSDSGGGDEWAHPFVGVENGETTLAYVANGSRGYFASRDDEQRVLTESLLAEGYQMTKCKFDEPSYQTLSDGSVIHMSDVMCQLILRNIRRGSDVTAAFSDAFCELPGEIVGLLLSLRDQKSISWARINMPMFVGFASHGAYLATTAIAFPEDAATEPQLLPPCAAGRVYQDHYTVSPFRAFPGNISPMTARVRREAYELICEELKREPRRLKYLVKAIKPLFDDTTCPPTDALVYEVFYSLYKSGVLKIEHRRVPGAKEGLDAPNFYMSL